MNFCFILQLNNTIIHVFSQIIVPLDQYILHFTYKYTILIIIFLNNKYTNYFLYNLYNYKIAAHKDFYYICNIALCLFIYT